MMAEKKYKVKIAELPEAWNTNCFVLEFQESSSHNGKLFISSSSINAPGADAKIGDAGKVYKRYLNGLTYNYVWSWVSKKKTDKKDENS